MIRDNMSGDIDDEQLQAYVDGELAPEAAGRVAAAIARDASLAARFERERGLRARLRSTFDPVLDEPVPDRLATLLAEPAGSTATPGARAGDGRVVTLERARRRPRWHAPVYALAASLAALAVTLWMRPAPGPLQLRGSELVARGSLAAALDEGLAGAAQRGGVGIGLTFRDADGRICRTFTDRDTALAGLACRSGNAWALDVLSRAASAPDGEVRQASSALTPEVQAALDARLAGDVFDAEAERAARAAGWR